jgi:hypothetical protein
MPKAIKPESETLHFNDEHYAAIGKVIVAFQSLEEIITFSLARLMRPDEVLYMDTLTSIVLNELSFTNKTKILGGYSSTVLAKQLADAADKKDSMWVKDYEEALKNLAEGLELTRAVESGRNQLVHSQWAAWPLAGPKGTVHRSKLRTTPKKLNMAAEFVSPAQIEVTCERAKQASNLIQKSVTELHYLSRELSCKPKN